MDSLSIYALIAARGFVGAPMSYLAVSRAIIHGFASATNQMRILFWACVAVKYFTVDRGFGTLLEAIEAVSKGHDREKELGFEFFDLIYDKDERQDLKAARNNI